MPIHIDPSVKRSDSLLVIDRRSVTSAPGSLGTYDVSFRAATKLESLTRNLRNFFTLGLHSRLSVNPTQWRILRANLLQDAQQSGVALNERVIERLFGAYSQSEKLTAAKLSNVLSDFERVKADPSWQPQFNPKFSDASQNPLVRAARSIQQLTRSLTPAERSVKDLATTRIEKYSQEKAKIEASNEDADGFDTDEEITASRVRPPSSDPQKYAQVGELISGIYAAQSMLHILRPGKTLGGDDLSYFFSALQKKTNTEIGLRATEQLNVARPTRFGYKQANWSTQSMQDVLNETRVLHREHAQVAAQAGERQGLFFVPLVLGGQRGLESHVVLIAIDVAREKINLLDSKGFSVESLESSYSNGHGLKDELRKLGKSIFGQTWSLDTGLQQLNIPKQQGANDCGAFVCNFAKLLLEGKSVGDIERSFDGQQRAELRLQAAQVIKEGFLDPLDQRLAQQSLQPTV
jgi:hypothetical protein